MPPLVIFLFVDFTHVPPSRYLFQGADLGKCSSSDMLDSSSGSSDNASLTNNPECCERTSPCTNEGQQPENEHCDGMPIEENSSQEKSNTTTPTSCQDSSTTETKNTYTVSSNHNETSVHDDHEPLTKKPKVDQDN